MSEEASTEEAQTPIRPWTVILMVAFLGALLHMGMFALFGAGKYNPMVHYKDYYLSDPQHNCTHFMSINFERVQTKLENVGGKLFCQDVDVGKKGNSKEKEAKRWIGRYYFALREDDRWVDMQVHHVVCRWSELTLLGDSINDSRNNSDEVTLVS
jgi:hypothetical protein